MVAFEEQRVLKQVEYLYDKRGEIEEIADELTTKGFENILFTSSGGSIAMMKPFIHMMKMISKIRTISEISAELVLTDHPEIGANTVAILASKSGDTKETVEAAEFLKKRNVTIISIIGVEDSPLEKLSTYTVHYLEGRPQELVFYFLLGKIMYNRQEFMDYPEFATELQHLGKVICEVSKQADLQALKYADKYKDCEYQIWIGSGNLEGPIYSFAMCTLEECQWLRTKFVTSPEFFHGTIELIEKGVCVALAMGEGITRQLDERVKRFVEQHTEDLNVFDTKEYSLTGISDKFRWLLSPVVMNAILARVAKNYEKVRDHSLEIRRFYRKVEY